MTCTAPDACNCQECESFAYRTTLRREARRSAALKCTAEQFKFAVECARGSKQKTLDEPTVNRLYVQVERALQTD